MTVTKKIDDIGRIAIPRDVRRELRWMGGDEIDIIINDNHTLTLQKHNVTELSQLYELRKAWMADSEICEKFTELINLLKDKTNE